MNKVLAPLLVTFPAVVALSLLLPDSVQAQHGAHVHSISNATLAIDRNQIEFNLQSPGANLVGFEHPPRDQAQVDALEQAKARLQSGDWLRFASDADCAVVQLELETPGFEPSDGHDHEHHHGHAHDDHDHYDHHTDHAHSDHHLHDEGHEAFDHDHYDHHTDHPHSDHHQQDEDHDLSDHDHYDHHSDHPHSDHHEHDADHKHAEFHLRVRAECGNIEELDWLEFALFEGWTDHREMQLDVLTDRLQQRFELNAEQNRIELD